MKIIKGDLIKLAQEGKFDVIIHGANCFCTFSAGIAKTIKTLFPEAYAVDCRTKKGDPRKLGTISHTLISDGDHNNFYIINAYTQFKHWREEGEDPAAPLVDYQAVKDVFALIKKDFGDRGLRFGIPKIGAGLALGDWFTISKIIEIEMKGEDITLVEFSA